MYCDLLFPKSFNNASKWVTIKKHERGYATTRIPYLLDAFLFDGKRIKLDQHYELFGERILYALIEYLRKNRTNEKQ